MPDDLQLAAARLKKANAANKRAIQTHRKKVAITKAGIERLNHPGKFPTTYKYG